MLVRSVRPSVDIATNNLDCRTLRTLKTCAERKLSNEPLQKPQISGTVAPGYESVKQLFEANMGRLAEENAQLCVYVGDEKVVDLCAAQPGSSFTADSIINMFTLPFQILLKAICSAVCLSEGPLTRFYFIISGFDFLVD